MQAGGQRRRQARRVESGLPVDHVAVFNTVVPSLKVTVPPGVPAPADVLVVAVSVTAWP